MTHELHPAMLREYDIVALGGQTLGADDACAIGPAFAAQMQRAAAAR